MACTWLVSLLLVGTVQKAAGRIGTRWEELTQSTFDNFLSSSERVAVDFYDSSDSDSQRHQQELNHAIVMVRNSGNMKLPLAKVDNQKEPELAKRFVKNGRFPQMVWFIHGKATSYHRTLRTAKNMADFVTALDRPALQQVNEVAAAGDYNRAVLAEVKDSSMRKALEVVALKHMDTLAILYLESSKNQVSWYSNGEKKATYEGKAESEDLEKWVRTQMPLRSEEVPEGGLPMDGASQTVASKNFEEMVLRNDKDVMLLVHAPWCGFCKKLAPAWEQFARMMESEANIVVAKLDGDRNESPLPGDFSWDAFPTIFYVRAGVKEPFVYRGNRTFESLVNFANQHTSTPFTGAGAAAGLVSDSAFDL